VPPIDAAAPPPVEDAAVVEAVDAGVDAAPPIDAAVLVAVGSGSGRDNDRGNDGDRDPGAGSGRGSSKGSSAGSSKGSSAGSGSAKGSGSGKPGLGSAIDLGGGSGSAKGSGSGSSKGSGSAKGSGAGSGSTKPGGGSGSAAPATGEGYLIAYTTPFAAVTVDGTPRGHHADHPAPEDPAGAGPAQGAVQVRRRHRPQVLREHVRRRSCGDRRSACWFLGLLIALQLATSRAEPRAVPDLRSPAPAAHQRGDLRVRGQRDLRRRVLLDAAPAEGAHVLRRAEPHPLLGLAADHRLRGAHAAARLHAGQGVRRARVADRHRDRGGVGGFAVNFFGTLRKRRERHLYVAIWFYIATIVTIAVLHIFNNLVGAGRGAQELPHLRRRAGRLHAVVVRPQRGGVLPHHAVPRADVLLPAQGGRAPVFSYRLSILHFWSLVFIYIWAGPHHLHYTALPEWASTLGMLFSRDAVDAVVGRHDQRPADAARRVEQGAADPVLKFFVVGITFYGMSTFEGPMLSIKSVNALSHYTDWTSPTCTAARWAGTASWRSAWSTGWRRACSRPSCGRRSWRTALLDRHHRHRAVRRLDVQPRASPRA
jgi:hypothetical protein